MWCALEGRWLTLSDMAGARPVALDMTQARALMVALGVKKKRRPALCQALLLMEQAALREMYPPS